MERLSVMGLVEVLGRLRELLKRRKKLIADLIAEKPDVFIGIDAPDFNLNIELKLRQAGIKTVHYVSPSVWAWRQKRVLKIREGCDLMLTLFPFEAKFYEEKGVPVRFVGHTLADAIPLEADRAAARAELGLPDGPLVALMPGSRGGEVGRLGALFLDTAQRLRALRPGVRFVMPCASPERRAQLEELLAGRDLPLTLLDGKSHLALAACDAVLIASGTATLEALVVQAADGGGLSPGTADVLDSQAHGQEPVRVVAEPAGPAPVGARVVAGRCDGRSAGPDLVAADRRWRRADPRFRRNSPDPCVWMPPTRLRMQC